MGTKVFLLYLEFKIAKSIFNLEAFIIRNENENTIKFLYLGFPQPRPDGHYAGEGHAGQGPRLNHQLQRPLLSGIDTLDLKICNIFLIYLTVCK